MKLSSRWNPCVRSDFILCNASFDSPELLRNFRIGKQVDHSSRLSSLSIVKSNWDTFYEQGFLHPVIDFELCIDTGDSVPVYCRQSNNGYHERKIMTQCITTLEGSELITDCERIWCSLLFFDIKPHQED